MNMWRLRGGDKLFGPLLTIDLSRKEKSTMTKDKVRLLSLKALSHAWNNNNYDAVDIQFETALLELLLAKFSDIDSNALRLQEFDDYLGDVIHEVSTEIYINSCEHNFTETSTRGDITYDHCSKCGSGIPRMLPTK